MQVLCVLSMWACADGLPGAERLDASTCAGSCVLPTCAGKPCQEHADDTIAAFTQLRFSLRSRTTILSAGRCKVIVPKLGTRATGGPVAKFSHSSLSSQ